MSVNQSIYRIWAPVYDPVFSWMMGKARVRTIELLNMRPGENLLIPGVGTGLDLPLIPAGVRVTGVDVSPEMLLQAKRKRAPQLTSLQLMDAQALEFLGETFDAALLNLVLSVVPDGRAAFHEFWRVLRPGGRMAIFDKFLPEKNRLTGGRRFMGWLISLLGTDPNRRLSDLIAGLPGLEIVRDTPSLLRGQYRILLIRKPERR